MRTLTLEDRRVIEKMWADNLKPVQIAAELGVSQCTVYPEVEEWPALCVAYTCGGHAVPTVPRPADELDLQIIREEGVRFLDRPEVSFAGLHEFCAPVPEQAPGYEWVLNSF